MVQDTTGPAPRGPASAPQQTPRHQELLPQIISICRENLTTIRCERSEFAVVSPAGLNHLINLGLNEVQLLQVAMKSEEEEEIEVSWRQSLLFCLLLERGLRVVRENGKIIAPIPELRIQTSLEGRVEFVGVDRFAVKADVDYFLDKKLEIGCPIHEIVLFILEELKKLPAEELLLQNPFRLKSYSSVMNKLFYRGKDLSDLLAAKVRNDDEVEKLVKKLKAKGAMKLPKREEDHLNGNKCDVSRCVRMLRVELAGEFSGLVFHFPVIYEIVRHNHADVRTSHEEYEYDRLKFELYNDIPRCERESITIDPRERETFAFVNSIDDIDATTILLVRYYFERQEKEVRVDVADLERICLQNSITFSLEGGQSEVAVSRAGLEEMRKLGEGIERLDEIGCLLISITKDRRVSDLLKRRILFGLLFARERDFTLIKEDGLIVVPSFETQVPVSSLPQGTISFQSRVSPDTPKDPPDISFLCHQKAECGIPIHQMIGFVLEELKKLPPSESLMDDRINFRLISYSSIMNKLFYRGKKLTDLFTTTVSTYAELDAVTTALKERGGIEIPGDLNSNDWLVYRYVRILLVNVGSNVFSFPVYYQIVWTYFLPARLPHEQYEFDRLQFSLTSGQMNMLRNTGFTFETPQ